ncbi:sensor histidine kinase [Paenibacillus hexagrammi]|uniref:histidine kinase n=1 Tax=Paenibacillus hexagrammi TaxID=2908839 RepID=A0ABY3SMU1_9BACL|nr:HAMP domain-containing sensor histidine kinase [Paenibacillus sp. YPD9-1]UJF34798.1 HAMP domain-containing histidine kinase [Paenibacillus sp. YPD9-1]
MLKSTGERKTLLQYWTIRYMIVLAVGLLIIGAGSFYFLEMKEAQKHLEVGRKLFQVLSSVIQVKEGRLEPGDRRYIDDITHDTIAKDMKSSAQFMIYLVDAHGRMISAHPDNMPLELVQVANTQRDVETGDDPLPIRMKDAETSYFVKRYQWQGRTIGYLYLLLVPDEMFDVPDYKKTVYLMFAVTFVLGWSILYVLTRRLIKPLKQVADGAKQIMNGSYPAEKRVTAKEKELYELHESFGEMAVKLGQLDYLRTKLLAGVTHELKTPVTSISGLVQAVRDEVVTGEDARTFMDLCYKETLHLQRMVEDLLEFNSYAVGAVKIQTAQINLNEWLKEAIQQWSLIETAGDVKVEMSVPDHPVFVMTDGIRLKQVLVNLLNNAKASTEGTGLIKVILIQHEEVAVMEVHDTGAGIPEHEQSYVFENFFRGERKQNKIRGMGLGLPLCRMIMKELSGEIKLLSSSSQGTVFSVSLQKDINGSL